MADDQTWEEVDKSHVKLVRVNGHVIHAFCEWVCNKIVEDRHKFCLFGAPFEADAQFGTLKIDGYTNDTLTEDSDFFTKVYVTCTAASIQASTGRSLAELL